MKFNLFIGLILASSMIITSCGGNQEEHAEEAENVMENQEVDKEKFMNDLNELEKRIEANTGAPVEADLKEAIVAYQDYATLFPEEKDAPTYLLKASDFALFTKQPEMSVKILSRIEDEFPNYEMMEDVMYNKASHLDFELRDTTKAKEAYQNFINTYPNSELVADAENRIENIRYSMEELTEMFIKQLEEEGAQ